MTRDELLARMTKSAGKKPPVSLLRRAKRLAVKVTVGLGAVGVGTGAVKAVGDEPRREQAPPTAVPPGY